MLFGECIHRHLLKFMKRGIDNIDSEQNKSRFEFSLLKERLSMLDPLSKARFT